MNDPIFLVVDLFCGAGGTTTGFVTAELEGKSIAKVIACVNHDHTAILSHWANNPEVKHYEEDIRNMDLSHLVELVNFYRNKFPNALLILWASLECTNFSKAKGGLARDADSRTLAQSLFMQWNESTKEYEEGNSYIQLLNPDYVMIENVVEFLDWGPSRLKFKNGKQVFVKNKHGEFIEGVEPIPERKGEDFKKWNDSICAFGYNKEWRQLNSADYGAFTSRNRLFGVFAKNDMPAVWPFPTHQKSAKNGLKKWVAVKEKLDFTDEGFSIFYRGTNMDIPKRQRKDLSENTLLRVYSGCIKHIAGGKKAFMIKYHGGPPRTNDLDKPLTVIDTQNRHAFVSIYHGNGDNTHSVDQPAPTIVSADIHAAVFIDRHFKTATNSSVDEPAGAIMTNPKLHLVKAELAFIDSSQYTNIPTSIDSPASVITANRKYPYLINLQWGGQMQGIDRPSPTLLATAHKTPIYLMTTDKGEQAIEIYKTDSKAIVDLKEFMALYGIIDIKMRMLRVDELLQIQGFPKDYRLCGNQTDQKKFIGNSVVPDVVKAWAEAMASRLIELNKRVA